VYTEFSYKSYTMPAMVSHSADRLGRDEHPIMLLCVRVCVRERETEREGERGRERERAGEAVRVLGNGFPLPDSVDRDRGV